MRRRRFLQTLGALAASARLPRARAASATTAIVVGAGPAGISAALELAERGVQVTLIEAASMPGGKVVGWTDTLDGEAVDVEHGMHGWWYQYVHFRDLLRRYGLLRHLRPFEMRENAMRGPDFEARTFGQRARLIRKRALARGWGPFVERYKEGLAYIRGLTPASARAELGGRSVARWIREDPLLTVYTVFDDLMSHCMYFLGPEEIDAAVYALGERFYFSGTTNNDEVEWLLGNPGDRVWAPLCDAIERRGGELRYDSPVTGLVVEDGAVVGVRLGAPPEAVELAPPAQWTQVQLGGWPAFVGPDGRAFQGRCTHQGCPVSLGEGGFECPCHGGRFDHSGAPIAGPPERPLAALEVTRGEETWTVRAPDTREVLRADAVILAVDAPALGKLAGELLPRTRDLRGCRAVAARFWLDRDVPRRDRAAVLLEGYRHASNGFLVHRLQDRAGAWAKRTGGAVIEIQAYRDLPELEGEALLDRIEEDLRQVWPQLADARVLKRTLTDCRTFTWFYPGWHEAAVPVETGIPGLLAAGDHVLVDRNCQFMERAVFSGRLAANAVLRSAGLPEAPILPPRPGGDGLI